MAIEFNKDELLENLKDTLKDEVSRISYDTWIKPLGIKGISDNNITFIAVSEYQKDFIENKFNTLILNSLKYLTNRTWTFTVIDSSSEDNTDNEEDYNNDENRVEDKRSIVTPKELEENHLSLSSKYTFENFVVGENNEFAYAAAVAVGNDPGKDYNPLYIYGGVGIGKTHLMQAIGNRILQNNKSTNVLYVTSEKFTNQLINAIKDYKMPMFRNKYRNVDVLLIDDIQFIAGKDRVQEEFFHTFNTLRENGKQIVITSDKLPKDIDLLEDRLKSRFEWGLLADISKADYEMRLAILRKKAETEHVVIDDFILSDIATKIDSNIRELEGVYNSVVAVAALTHSPITIEQAEKAINKFKNEKDKVISSDYIKETVAKYFSIEKSELSSAKRSNDIAFPRQIAMYLCREVANMSFPQIGIDFGNRDHSTVMHSYNKIAKEVKEKKGTRLIVESVKNIITGEQNQ